MQVQSFLEGLISDPHAIIGLLVVPTLKNCLCTPPETFPPALCIPFFEESGVDIIFVPESWPSLLTSSTSIPLQTPKLGCVLLQYTWPHYPTRLQWCSFSTTSSIYVGSHSKYLLPFTQYEVPKRACGTRHHPPTTEKTRGKDSHAMSMRVSATETSTIGLPNSASTKKKGQQHTPLLFANDILTKSVQIDVTSWWGWQFLNPSLCYSSMLKWWVTNASACLPKNALLGTMMATALMLVISNSMNMIPIVWVLGMQILEWDIKNYYGLRNGILYLSVFTPLYIKVYYNRIPHTSTSSRMMHMYSLSMSSLIFFSTFSFAFSAYCIPLSCDTALTFVAYLRLEFIRWLWQCSNPSRSKNQSTHNEMHVISFKQSGKTRMFWYLLEWVLEGLISCME